MSKADRDMERAGHTLGAAVLGLIGAGTDVADGRPDEKTGTGVQDTVATEPLENPKDSSRNRPGWT